MGRHSFRHPRQGCLGGTSLTNTFNRPLLFREFQLVTSWLHAPSRMQQHHQDQNNKYGSANRVRKGFGDQQLSTPLRQQIDKIMALRKALIIAAVILTILIAIIGCTQGLPHKPHQGRAPNTLATPTKSNGKNIEKHQTGAEDIDSCKFFFRNRKLYCKVLKVTTTTPANTEPTVPRTTKAVEKTVSAGAGFSGQKGPEYAFLSLVSSLARVSFHFGLPPSPQYRQEGRRRVEQRGKNAFSHPLRPEYPAPVYTYNRNRGFLG